MWPNQHGNFLCSAIWAWSYLMIILGERDRIFQARYVNRRISGVFGYFHQPSKEICQKSIKKSSGPCCHLNIWRMLFEGYSLGTLNICLAGESTYSQEIKKMSEKAKKEEKRPQIKNRAFWGFWTFVTIENYLH